MRILILGNSFTYENDLPAILGDILGEKVDSHTRGGAKLEEHLDPSTELGEKTQKAFQEEKWDFVVLQEFSNEPVIHPENFFRSAKALAKQARENGAKVILYATFPYEENGPKMAEFDFSYDEMFYALYEQYHKLGEEIQAPVADVGKAFYELRNEKKLYGPDAYHPNLEGTTIAAEIIAETIRKEEEKA